MAQQLSQRFTFTSCTRELLESVLPVQVPANVPWKELLNQGPNTWITVIHHEGVPAGCWLPSPQP